MKMVLLIILAVSLLAPIIAPHDPYQQDLENSLTQPSAAHWLGTDLLGRDVFSRVVHGGRQSIGMAAGATLLAVGFGLMLGVVSSRYAIFTTWMDALLAVPALLIALVMVTVLGQGAWSVVLAVGISQVGSYARTTRDAILTVQHLPYVEAAVAIGVPPRRIMTHYILRNAAPVLLTFAAVTFSWALLNSAALAFLGLAGDPSTPDWGVMLASGRETFVQMPFEALAAGVLLSLTVGAVNGLGG